MSYRDPAPPPRPPASPELDAYEQKLLRSARRKKLVFALMVGGMAIFGMGSCLGPIAIEVTASAWESRTNKLTKAEAARASAILDPIEPRAKKSQAAFEALWPRLIAGQIGAREDLGACRVSIPGPNIRKKETSTSLSDSSGGAGWTFVDLTPPDARSPLATLRMPGGSIALNNTGTGDRFVLPDRELRSASADKPPVLDSTKAALRLPEWKKEASEKMRHDNHESFLTRAAAYAEDTTDLDVVVFVDFWEDPKFSNDVLPAPKDDLESFERGSVPTRIFDVGMAIGRAFAWSPKTAEIVCASQALAVSSDGIRFKSNDRAPLQQDLVLQLERSLQRAFVAVGDAPPRLERRAAPPPSSASEKAPDAGAPAPAPKKRHR